MERIAPESAEQLAALLKECASGKRRIRLQGAGSKDRMGGPPGDADICLSTAALNRVLEYEPQDLTVSAEAGVLWRDLQDLLAQNHQMVPLDPPHAATATVGGVVAANCSGPRRRLYGTARDVVIGMRFATLEGKLVQSGGLVVKNVAGLDMGKLMIGSFGTLTALAVVNFKVSPVAPFSRTFVYSSAALEEVMGRRDRLLESVLQPAALDLLNPHAAARAGLEGWSLLVQAVGNEKVIQRWERECAGARTMAGGEEASLWERIREFTPAFLAQHEDGAVARVSSQLRDLGAVVQSAPVPLVARAGTGVTYAHFADCESAGRWLKEAVAHGRSGVLEWIARRQCTAAEQWPNPGTSFDTMQRVKRLFDADGLLNRGRLYGRI
jgi:glycolate oxidase FAD binding subunit